MPPSEAPPPGVSTAPGFSTTNWSVVLAAGAVAGEQTEARAALAALCRTYWYPIYVFMRRDGCSPADAQDLTQECFSRLIGKRHLEGLEPSAGRFRSFLLVTVKHFLSDERKRASAQKRGGGVTVVSIDEEDAESRYRFEPADLATPELLYEKAWANAVLARVIERLRARHAESGNTALYAALEPRLIGETTALSYRDLGSPLGLSEGAVKVAAHRLRRECGRILRDEISMTVTDPADVDAEIRRLIEILGSPGAAPGPL